jgi:hypothetical protein
MLDPTYQMAVGGNLVLSSAEFGRAYLSEGWAARFIRDAIAKYAIVFVGYTADDPPVQYLLEALNRDHGRERQPMYAFQPGLQSEAAAHWAHKGVTALPYDDRSQHAALWHTLAAWAERARDPEAWRTTVLRRALAGPGALTPHERGQMMHLAMTPDGVKTIVTAKRKLPASWLLVFDPAERYETPGRRTLTAEEAAIDSFPDYRLDSDPPPKPDESGTLFAQRKVPNGVLDALIANPFDPPSAEHGAIYGENAVSLVSLPPRLRALTAWIASVAEQPLAIWWALNKPLLNPVLLQSIEGRFLRAQDRMPDKARTVWRTMLDARRPTFRPPFQNIYELQGRVTDEGWTPAARRTLMTLLRPQMGVSRRIAAGPVKDMARARPYKIMGLNLRYQDEVTPPPIPDDELAAMTPMVRRLLEEVSAQEDEVNPFTLNHIPPIHLDPRVSGTAYERDHGFNRLVFWYIGSFQRLLALNSVRARRGFDGWLTHDNTLFYRLRVWACGLPGFLPAEVATQTLATLSDEAFWTERGQRDLLLSLKARWTEFEGALHASVEERLLKGPPRLKGLSRDSHREWRAHASLERVLWLIREGCTFQRPVDAVLAKARAAAPRWQDAFAARAADSREAQVGFVTTNPKFDHIKDAPIRDLLALCIADSGHDHQFLVERDPLGGLAEKQPIRVLRALLLDALPDDRARLWAWSKFLQANIQRENTARRTHLIAQRLLEISDALFALIVQPVSYWLERHAKMLYRASAVVGAVADRIITALVQSSGDEDDGARNRSSDWLNPAITSPSGHMLEALFHDPDLAACAAGAGLPPVWKARTERGLALPRDHGLFALFQVGKRLGWLYSRDRTWTEANILSALSTDSDRREVTLTAFLHKPEWDSRNLYNHMKKPILQLISGEMTKPKADPRTLAFFTLQGWCQTDADGRWFTDVEMRTALVRGSQEFRTTTLWQVSNLPFSEKRDFLAQVWPLQLAARSGTITDRLCHIAFHDPKHFAELAQIILPFLTPIRRSPLMFAADVANANELMAANPAIALELYWRILPEHSAEWPYDAHQGLEYLYKNVKALRTDPRMIELMRRRRKGYF